MSSCNEPQFYNLTTTQHPISNSSSSNQSPLVSPLTVTVIFQLCGDPQNWKITLDVHKQQSAQHKSQTQSGIFPNIPKRQHSSPLLTE